MPATLPKVLIFEENKSLQGMWKSQLEGKVEIIPTNSINEAERLYVDSPKNEISAIVITATDIQNIKRIIFVTRSIKDTFKGSMIVASALESTREALLKAGCDHSCEKKDLASTILKVLGL